MAGLLGDDFNPADFDMRDAFSGAGDLPIHTLQGRTIYPGQRGPGGVLSHESQFLGGAIGGALMRPKAPAGPALKAPPIDAPPIEEQPVPAAPVSLPAIGHNGGPPLSDINDRPPTLTPVQAAASLESSFPHATAMQFPTGRDFRVSQEERFAQQAGNKRGRYQAMDIPNQDTHLVPLGVHDALYALKSNPDAVGWYDRTVRKALSVLSTIHPELQTDPHSAFAHRFALAVTSNGMKVDKNFQLADQAYEGWLRSGATPDERRMPTDIGKGTAGKAINKGLALFNKLVDHHGYEGAFKFLGSNFTVGDLNKMKLANEKVKVTGEKAGETVKGAAILGPKIGNGFYSNLNGHFDALTMDRWFTRTWGRWTGRSIEQRPDMVASKGDELAGHIQRLTPKQLARFESATGVKLNASDPQATATAIKEASADPALRASMNKVGKSVGGDIRKTANMLFKYMDGQIEQPKTAQRPFMRQTMSKILDNLNARGYNLNMSDLQALLWYPEKRLYDSAGKKPGIGMKSYDPGDPDIPDYASAAVKLAKARGKTDDEINAALNAAHAEHTIRFPGRPPTR